MKEITIYYVEKDKLQELDQKSSAFDFKMLDFTEVVDEVPA